MYFAKPTEYFETGIIFFLEVVMTFFGIYKINLMNLYKMQIPYWVY
jgi:hypothetical protein